MNQPDRTLLDPNETVVPILGSKLAYWTYPSVSGSSAPVILAVHGFRGTHHGLEDIIAMAPEYTWIVPDLPGFGGSSPMSHTSHDVAGYAQAMKGLIAHLDLKKPPIVLGHSFGSIIAANLASEDDVKLDKLILINPIARNPGKIGLIAARIYYGLGSALSESAAKKYFSSKTGVMAMSLTLAKTKQKVLRSHIHNEHMQHFSSFSDLGALSEAFRASIGDNVANYAAKIDTKTLLIAGAKDIIAPVETQYRLLEIFPKPPQLFVIPKVGHLVHYETPEAAARAIGTFIEGK